MFFRGGGGVGARQPPRWTLVKAAYTVSKVWNLLEGGCSPAATGLQDKLWVAVQGNGSSVCRPVPHVVTLVWSEVCVTCAGSHVTCQFVY